MLSLNFEEDNRMYFQLMPLYAYWMPSCQPRCRVAGIASLPSTTYDFLLGVGDTFSESIQSLNFAEKLFNSIFDSILLNPM